MPNGEVVLVESDTAEGQQKLRRPSPGTTWRNAADGHLSRPRAGNDQRGPRPHSRGDLQRIASHEPVAPEASRVVLHRPQPGEPGFSTPGAGPASGSQRL